MEIHINVDNIDYIDFTSRGRTKLSWFPYVPAKKIFGFIIVEHEQSEGWAQESNWNRSSPKYILGDNYVFEMPEEPVDGSEYPTNGHWESKARVYIRTKESSHYGYFDTDKEAELWIAGVKEKSKHSFDIIKK